MIMSMTNISLKDLVINSSLVCMNSKDVKNSKIALNALFMALVIMESFNANPAL